MSNSTTDNEKTPKRRQSDQVRLESWKAIANYLNRSVRTVRRWEQTQDLPVRRLRHSKGSSVYAYQSELDRWMASHEEECAAGALADVPADDNSQQRPHRRTTRYALVASLAALASVAFTILIVPDFRTDTYAPSTGPAISAATDYWPDSNARVIVAPAFSAWADGRVDEALSISTRIEENLPQLSGATRDMAVVHLVELYLSLGRVRASTALLHYVSQDELRATLRASIEFASGDMARVADVLRFSSSSDAELTRQTAVFAAMDELRVGDRAAARMRLEAAVSHLSVADQGYFFVATDMLAQILKEEGKLDAAIATLERTMPVRSAAAKNQSGLFWLMCQRQLATLYRDAGRQTEARRSEDELRHFLQHADDQFPLAASLVET